MTRPSYTDCRKKTFDWGIFCLQTISKKKGWPHVKQDLDIDNIIIFLQGLQHSGKICQTNREKI